MPIRLAQLQPQYVLWRMEGERQIHTPTDTIEEAMGIRFKCPLCFKDNEYSIVGVHQCLCWTPKVPPQVQPGPGRWVLSGHNYQDLTMSGGPGGSDSILLSGGCNAHFFVKNGEIQLV